MMMNFWGGEVSSTVIGGGSPTVRKRMLSAFFMKTEVGI